ncbi:hypothetical protein BDR22DRAFT_378868 [Usnea florida]
MKSAHIVVNIMPFGFPFQTRSPFRHVPSPSATARSSLRYRFAGMYNLTSEITFPYLRSKLKKVSTVLCRERGRSALQQKCSSGLTTRRQLSRKFASVLPDPSLDSRPPIARMAHTLSKDVEDDRTYSPRSNDIEMLQVVNLKPRLSYGLVFDGNEIRSCCSIGCWFSDRSNATSTHDWLC